MENQHEIQGEQHHSKPHHKGGSFLGTVLVILGIIWILRETGWLHKVPGWHAVQHSFHNFSHSFRFDFMGITWPLILLIVGIILVSGRRLVGTILILLAIFFFLPGLLIIPGILTVFFLPVMLIILGIVVISRLL